MNEPPLRVLVVEEHAPDAPSVAHLLSTSALAAEVRAVGTLSQSIALLRDHRFDIVLLDLFLRDSSGLDTQRAIAIHAVDTPIVILTSRRHQPIALQAVRAGAQDFLAREGMKREMLVRAISYAIERHRLLDEIRTASLRDELTGLYNRRGFTTLAEQQVRFAVRNSRPMALLFADLDGMKRINDSFGHGFGDDALRAMTEVLRRTFRACDVLARIGGDEFVALGLDADHGGADVIVDRLQNNVAEFNAEAGRPYRLSASTGMAVFDPDQPLELDELLARADSAMYSQKRTKSRGRGVAAR
jgi:two-component system, cell cycle response regulator